MAKGNNSMEEKFAYGWFSVRPSFLQFLNTPKWLLFVWCHYALTQSVIMSGILPASVSTIERRFGFSSNMMGVLISTYDIASLLLTPFIGYLGETRRKGVWCAYGSFVLGLGYFVFIVPHLVLGRYEAGTAVSLPPALCGSANLTNSTVGRECMQSSGSTNTGLYIVFLVAQVLTGAGSVPMIVLAVPFLDENVKTKVLPTYLGVFFTAAIVGILLGSVLSSVFLSIYVDIGVSTSLSVDNERWVGAWWLGFAIFSAVAVFWSLWIMGFPRELLGSKAIREEENRNGNNHLNGEFPARYVKFSDMLKATRHLLTYASYIAVTFGVSAEEFLITGIGAFLAKLIQIQFQYTASFASILFGIVGGAAAMTGNLLGAYINRRLKLNCTGAAKMCFIVAVFGLLSTIPLFIRCDNIPIAGVNSPYPNSTLSNNVTAHCNRKCHCADTLQYNPMCGEGLTYFSPCHAGCIRGTSANETFLNCSCVARRGENTWPGGVVTQGECKADCGAIPPIWILVAFLVSLFTFLNSIPASYITLRCVPVDQRSYALALQWCLIRLLGTIPGPIVFGYLIDQACVLWDNSCDERGSCFLYNNYHLGLSVLFICLACKVVSVISFGLAWVFCRRQFKTTGTSFESTRQVVENPGSVDEREVHCDETKF